MKFKKGQHLTTAAIQTLSLLDWTEGDGSGHEGYSYLDYFDVDDNYLGPDDHGIEPIFED